MKKYIVLPFAVSIIYHFIFFGIFNIEDRAIVAQRTAGLHIMTAEQFDYLKSSKAILKGSEIIVMPKTLCNVNPLWADTLRIVSDTAIIKFNFELEEDIAQAEENKESAFQDVRIPVLYYDYIPEEVMPIFNDIFRTEMFLETLGSASENVILLNDGKFKMGYYIQGPVSYRNLDIANTQDAVFNINRYDAKMKFRLWVTRDGRINQVLIEEGSSYPMIDLEVVKMIKSWHFNPVFEPTASNYDWGVVNVRLMK